MPEGDGRKARREFHVTQRKVGLRRVFRKKRETHNTLERVFPPEVKVNPRTVGGVHPIDKLPDAGGAPRNVKGKVGS